MVIGDARNGERTIWNYRTISPNNLYEVLHHNILPSTNAVNDGVVLYCTGHPSRIRFCDGRTKLQVAFYGCIWPTLIPWFCIYLTQS